MTSHGCGPPALARSPGRHMHCMPACRGAALAYVLTSRTYAPSRSGKHDKTLLAPCCSLLRARPRHGSCHAMCGRARSLSYHKRSRRRVNNSTMSQKRAGKKKKKATKGRKKKRRTSYELPVVSCRVGCWVLGVGCVRQCICMDGWRYDLVYWYASLPLKPMVGACVAWVDRSEMTMARRKTHVQK